ncbi:MAG: Ig-like domain-containing protein, partial [Thermomicrobium sp.]
FQVGDTTGQGDVSGFTLFNPTARQQLANVQLLAANGAAVAPSQVGTSENPVLVAVPAGGYAVIYPYSSDFGTTFNAAPRNFTGTALVGVTDGTGSGTGFLVGVSNVVNYQVQGDGSGVFVLTPTRNPSLTLTNFQLVLQPSVTLAPVNTNVPFVATLTSSGNPLPGRTIRFQISSEGQPQLTPTVDTTDVDGHVTTTATNTQAVTNTVTAWWDLNGNGSQDTTELSDSSRVTWVPSVSGQITVLRNNNSITTVPAADLAGNNTVTVQVECDISPDTPTGIPVLLQFTTTDHDTGAGNVQPRARWASQQSPSASGVTSLTTGANNVASASLVLVDGDADINGGDQFTISCYLDYGLTGVLEATDPLLGSATVTVTP